MKKGITPIMTMILLILIVVGIGGIYATWLSDKDCMSPRDWEKECIGWYLDNDTYNENELKVLCDTTSKCLYSYKEEDFVFVFDYNESFIDELIEVDFIYEVETYTTYVNETETEEDRILVFLPCGEYMKICRVERM